MPDTSIIDRRLAMLAANPPDPTPDPEPPTATAPTPPAWHMDESAADHGREGWSHILRGGTPGYPILVLTFLTARDPGRPRRVQADGPERLAAEVLDAARNHSAVGKMADLGRRIADAEEQRLRAVQEVRVAKARRTLIEHDPPPAGLAAALRANDAERERAQQDADDREKELRVLRDCRGRARDELAASILPAAEEATKRLRDGVFGERGRLLAEIDAFVSARAERLAHLTAVAMHLNGLFCLAAAQAAERAVLGDGE